MYVVGRKAHQVQKVHKDQLKPGRPQAFRAFLFARRSKGRKKTDRVTPLANRIDFLTTSSVARVKARE